MTLAQSNKKAKLDVAEIAWEHYRNFLDSQEHEDNEEGDVDELVALLDILEPHVNPSTTNDFETMESLLPVLYSVAHYHLADDAIRQTVDQQDVSEEDEQKVTHHLQQSLKFYSKNAATWSMGANYARMTQKASPGQVCEWYKKAAEFASELRTIALTLLEGPNSVEDNNVKEWIELLIMDGIVGAEYIEEGDDEEASESQHERQDEGHFSASNVEATSRFMAAMLLSTLGQHDEARHQLQRFHLTHRLHPNAWTATPANTVSSTPTITTKLSLQEPFSFPHEALPTSLYNRLCQVLAPDANYWKESDYAHRGYYSYFMPVQKDKPPSNLIEEVVIQHLLPRAQHVLKSAGDETKIVGAEWWPHTRPVAANLGHQMHFDTDEVLLAQESKVTHPILSSVLYLTGNPRKDNSNPAGATIVLDQTPDSDQVAATAWKSFPQDNRFMVFPGNRLHGVLPCPGDRDKANNALLGDTETLEWNKTSANNNTKDEPVQHRLTFMVGFWTRNVPEKMNERKLYGPCGPLPPATDEHSWVREIQERYPKTVNGGERGLDKVKLETVTLPRVSPAWEDIRSLDREHSDDPPLEVPGAIDHRFFVRGAPQFFRESLFHND